MLKRYPLDRLEPDLVLPAPLCNETGLVLLPAGTVLTEELLTRLGHSVDDLYVGPDWVDSGNEAEDSQDPAQAQGPSQEEASSSDPNDRVISVSELTEGIQLDCNIHDDKSILLLSSGTVITNRFLKLLENRNVRYVHLRRPEPGPDVESAPAGSADEADQPKAEAEPEKKVPRIGKQDDEALLPINELWQAAKHGIEQHRAISNHFAEVSCDILQGRDAAGTQLYDLIRNFTRLSTLDRSLLSLVAGVKKVEGASFYERCVNVALLSMTVATQWGVSGDSVSEVGIGALLQDLGMLRVPKSIRTARRSLTIDEWIEVRRQPVHSLDYLEHISCVPVVARHIAYQVHERNDGSGYPRGRSGMLIHKYAKIVSITHTYDAMTSLRPDRPALSPYEAVMTVLKEGSAHRFDRDAVRAFLDCQSIYPIGSTVELEDGYIARVVRATPGMHTRPVVQVLDSAGEVTDEVIDLIEEPNLKIIRGLP